MTASRDSSAHAGDAHAVMLSADGTLALPRAVLERLNLRGGEMLLVDVGDDGSIRLRPAAVLPNKLYSEAWIREFEETSEVDDATRARVAERLARATR